MAYCGYNDLWQCGNTDRTNPISCNLSHTTTSDSSTFFMIEPTKLAKGSILQSTEPTTTQTQFIPTQWGKPEAATSATSAISLIVSQSMTSTTTSSSITSVSTMTQLPSSSATSNPSSSSSGGLPAGADAGIAIAGLIVAIATLWVAWKQYRKKGSGP